MMIVKLANGAYVNLANMTMIRRINNDGIRVFWNFGVSGVGELIDFAYDDFFGDDAKAITEVLDSAAASRQTN